MQTCAKCNHQSEDNAAYCEMCGSRYFEVVFCPDCGEKTSSEFDYCKNCGKPIKEDFTEPAFNPAKQQSQSKPVLKKGQIQNYKLSRKALVPIAALVLVAAIVLGFVLFPIKASPSNSLVYLKDGEINYTLLSKVKPIEISDDLNTDVSNPRDYFFLGYLKFIVSCSSDGRYLFYPDKYESSDGTLSYYRRDLKADPAKADSIIKIDSEIKVGQLDLVNQGQVVFYIKGSDNRLYSNNFKDKQKLDDNVSRFFVNDTGDYLIYVTHDSGELNLYENNLKEDGEKVKIASDVNLEHVSDDLSKIYYTKEGSLYLKERNKDIVKMASDVEGVIKFVEGIGCYYIKSESEDISLENYVTDDKATEDSQISGEPDPEAFMTQTWVESFWGGYWDKQIDNVAYQMAYNLYSDKLRRDQLRQALAASKIPIPNQVLYYHDGTSEKMITENFSATLNNSTKSATLIYSKINQSEIPKIKLSEIYSTNDVEQLILSSLSVSDEKYFAQKEIESTIDQSNALQFEFNNSGDALYYLDDYDYEDQSGTLMEVKIEGDKLSDAVKIDEEVGYYWFKNNSDDYIYFKNIKNNNADMYQSNNLIASDVRINSVCSLKNMSQLVYLTDYSDESQDGTLNLFDNGKAKKIAYEVSQFQVENPKKIVYLTDYSIEKAKGDAKLFDGTDKQINIDEDVSRLIWILDNYRESFPHYYAPLAP